MTWLFVYRQTYTVEPTLDSVRLPILFQPYHRLIIRAVPLTGVSVNERFLGNLSQLLFVDGFGDVKGETVNLPSGYLLLVPSTEFNFRLLFQPAAKRFTFELSLWSDSATFTPDAGSGVPTVDLTPVETSIATLQEQTAGLSTDLAAVQDQLTEIGTAIAAIQTLLAPPDPTPTPPPTPSAAGVIYTASQSSLRSGSSFFQATYANLTDGEQSTGGVTDSTYGAWIMATFPSLVKVTQITLSGGTLDGYGDSSGSQNGAMLQSTTDGSTWTNVVAVSGIPNYTASGSEVVNFPLSVPIDVTAIRLLKDGEVAMPRFEFT